MIEKNSFHCLRDSREQKGWFFPKGGSCDGTTVSTLATGDYTLRGYEEKFVIERKGSTGEFAKNITENRFDRELERLDAFKHPFLICEFSMSDILQFPINSGIPPKIHKHLRITSEFILKQFLMYQVKYKTKIILAGTDGFRCAWSLFKRIAEHG